MARWQKLSLRNYHLEPYGLRGLRLLGVVGHESAKSELFHRGEVEPVQRSNVRSRALTVLAQCGLEDGPGQCLDRERVALTQEAWPLS